MRMTRDEAVAQVGADIVAKVEGVDVDFTNRVTSNGQTEFSASVKADDGIDDLTVIMYVFVDSEIVDACEDLSDINWDSAIANAEFEVI